MSKKNFKSSSNKYEKQQQVIQQQVDIDQTPIISKVDYLSSPSLEMVAKSIPLISPKNASIIQNDQTQNQIFSQNNDLNEIEIIKNLTGRHNEVQSLGALEQDNLEQNLQKLQKQSSYETFNNQIKTQQNKLRKEYGIRNDIDQDTANQNKSPKSLQHKNSQDQEYLVADPDLEDKEEDDTDKLELDQANYQQVSQKIRDIDIDQEVKNIYKNLDKSQKIKMKIYLTMFDAEYSYFSKAILIFMLCVSITDVTLMILSTEKSLPVGDNFYWEYFNSYSFIVFLIEKILQIYSCNSFIKGSQAYKNYFLQFNTIVEFMALFYSIYEAIAFNLSFDFSDQIKILRALFTLRLIRVFKFQSINRGINILIAGVKQSVQALSILLFITIICIILISSLMYFLEKGDNSSKIQNIPEAVWWAVITITTVGYGDVIPDTLAGKILASVSLIFGVLLLSLPVAIIGNNFQEIYLQNQKDDKNTSKKSMKRQYQETKNEEEKEILRIWLKINELEEVNETIEKCLQENQFLYRSIAREAQSLINRIEFSDKKSYLSKFSDSYVEGYDKQDPIVKKIKQQYLEDNQIQSFITYRAKSDSQQ
ncbi:cation channel family protein (macronuclear) [Tetrahymena thermophila SB210]|uniref:Cation channel family protein n=1 Tax=Tetrahymena thermophila (strain SB210) TaxID=312017 RepID=W7XG89_TETTS|nr:cation channel family protein [Tetrahymena thermophila SB210]EWS71859.1 cation channel family protein [Tetrahymena thermophila SB210]|eukprot:XP_012655603.1 cation channel family protein [Tetrahymena thermophila SB210]